MSNIERIPILQYLFDHFGAIPTYLVDYPFVANEGARHLLKQMLVDRHCEIGTHCHPWNTPPFEETTNTVTILACKKSSASGFPQRCKLHH